MNNGNQKLNLNIAVFLVLLMGAFVPLNQAFMYGPSGSNTQETRSASQAVFSPVIVRVTQPQPAVLATAGSVKTADTSCQSLGLSNSQNLIQPQAAINLNQPASCYKLGFVSTVSAPAITVEALNRQPVTITVVSLPEQSLNALRHLPAALPELPTLPLSSFILLTTFFLLSDRKLKQINLKPIITYFSPNSFVLCPMRC